MDTFPPTMRHPTTSGGFYKYPKNTRTMDASASATTTVNLGPGNQLIDLSPLSPGARAARELTGVNYMYARYNPTSDVRVENLRSIASSSQDLRARPSLVSSFTGIVDYQGEEGIEFAEDGKLHRSTQTEMVVERLELESISETQKWTKETVEPFLKVNCLRSFLICFN